MLETSVQIRAVALAAFVALSLIACTVEFDPTQDQTFSCQEDQDCLSNFECSSNVCVRRTGGGVPTCNSDQDGDGYGSAVNPEDRQACDRCKTLGQCQVDCDDTNDKIYPGAAEGCDGLNNNCDADGAVDEVTTCSASSDCASAPTGAFVTCENASGFACGSEEEGCACVVKMALQICTNGEMDCMCNANPILCVSGSWAPIPPECQ
jgi:hypothetical protein